MRKSTRIVKRILALFLVVLMSINTLGAVVSDNDGSAFITKAEFDSLKNNFQSQIDQYNTSIDSKIDGAIASYLAGIKTNSPPTILLEQVKFSIGDDIKFHNDFEIGTDLATMYTIIDEKSYSISYDDSSSGDVEQMTKEEFLNKNKDKYVREAYFTNSGGGSVAFWNGDTMLWAHSLNQGYAQSIIFCFDSLQTERFKMITAYDSQTKPGGTWISKSFDAVGNSLNLGAAGSSSSAFQHFDLSEFSEINFFVSSYRCYVTGQKTLQELIDSGYAANWAQNKGISFKPLNEQKHYNFQKEMFRIDGSGSAWLSRQLSNGNNELLGFTETYPIVFLNWASHWYRNFPNTLPADGAYDVTAQHTHYLSLPTTWASEEVGTHCTAFTATDNIFWYSLVLSLYRGALQCGYAQKDQWGANTNQDIKYVDLFAQPIHVSTSDLENGLSWSQTEVEIRGYTQKLGEVQVTMNGINLPASTAKMNEFENRTLSAIANEAVYMGGGVPLLRMHADSDTEYKVTMKLKLFDSNDAATSGNINVRLSKKQFVDGLFARLDDALYEINVTTDADGTATIEINLTGVENDKIVWFNLNPETSGYSASCIDCEVKVL